jgi:hypothetical protein
VFGVATVRDVLEDRDRNIVFARAMKPSRRR